MLELVLPRRNFHLDDNGINLLKVPRPHLLREYDDIGHYNALNRLLLENVSFFNPVILDGIDKPCQNFTCLASMGGSSFVDYLIGDLNSLHKFIYDFSIGNKQPDSHHCLFLLLLAQHAIV